MRRTHMLGVWVVLALLGGCAPEGDPSGFVTFNIPPDGNCRVSPSQSDVFIPIGLYDIAPGGTPLGNRCEHPYFVNLLVNSFLRSNAQNDIGRSEPNILQLHSAEVLLTTVAKEVIDFNRGDPLPNPFLVTTNNSLPPSRGTNPTTGIAAVEAIPVAYAEQLNNFDGKQILAEIQIFGTTTGDVDVDFRPFVFPIEICNGCLTLCLGDIAAAGDVPDDYVDSGECDDNAGADGRVCFDPDC